MLFPAYKVRSNLPDASCKEAFCFALIKAWCNSHTHSKKHWIWYSLHNGTRPAIVSVQQSCSQSEADRGLGVCGRMELIDANKPVISSSILLACHYRPVSGENGDRFVRGTCSDSRLTRGAAPSPERTRVHVHRSSLPSLCAADISMPTVDMYTHVHICVCAWAWHFHAVCIRLCWLTGGRFCL